MAVGVQEAFGSPAAPEDMRTLGGSDFGSTFFVAEPVGSASWHVRTRRTSLNWLPVPMAQRLALVSMSISNVVGSMQCELGLDAREISFVRPTQPATFDEVWGQSPGVTKSSIDSVMAIHQRDECSR